MEECQNCHLKFGTSTSLGYHIKKVHPEYTYVRKNLKCTNCDYSAKSQTVINEHYKRCCKTEIQTCDMCEFRGSSYNLSKHFKLEHPNPKILPISTRTSYGTRQNKNAVVKQEILDKVQKQIGNWIVKLERLDLED